MIQRYDIKTEDVIIQSGNALTQYKNRHAFALLQKLANEFNSRIIRTYGAAGHGKGTINAKSSFGVKNVLRRDIVTQDIFFDKSEDYLNIKNPQFHYAHIDIDILAEKRHLYTGGCTPIEIKGCMEQHLTVFNQIQQKLCVVNTFVIVHIVLIYILATVPVQNYQITLAIIQRGSLKRKNVEVMVITYLIL